MGVKRAMDPLLRHLRRLGGPILLFSLLIGAFGRVPKQLLPHYADMPARHWIAQLDLPREARDPRAFEALGTLHEHCLFDLQSRLKSSDPLVRRLKNRLAALFPSWLDTVPPADRARQAAAEFVSTCGPAVAVLADALAVGLRKAQTAATVEALEDAALSIGPPSVRPLAALALANDQRAQARALHALSRLVPARPWPPQLKSDLATLAASQTVVSNTALALAAHELLSALGDDAAHTLPAVLANLGHPSPKVRAVAARFAGRLARRSDLCVPPLIRCLAADPDEGSRAAAATALGRFGVEASSATIILAERTQELSTSVALAAIHSLGRIRPPATLAHGALAQALDDPRPEVRAGSATALGRLRSGSKEIIDKLATRLLDDEEYVRLSAARALTGMGPTAESAIDPLMGALSDSSEAVRVTAAEALGCIGPAAARARPFLLAACNNNPSVMTRPVLAALAQIEFSGAPGVLRTGVQEAKPGR
jgi:HEAT repeat protein